MRLSRTLLMLFILNALWAGEPEVQAPSLGEVLREALDPGKVRKAGDPWPQALIDADPAILRSTLREKSFLPVSEVDILAMSLVDPPGSLFRDIDEVPADQRAFLLTPEAPGLFPLVILAPCTGADAQALLGQADMWVKKGYGALLVPPRKVGVGWTAKPQEHEDILRLLRLALLQTRADPDRVYIEGFSRGGHASWDVGLRHAERFAAIAPSGGTTTHEGGFEIAGGVFLGNGLHLPVIVGHGAKDAEAVVMGNRLARDHYHKHSWTLDFHEDPQMGHDTPLNFEDIVNFFGSHTRKTWPAKLDKLLNAPDFDGDCGWIEVLELSGPPFDFDAPLVMNAPIPKDRDGKLRRNWATVREGLARVEGKVDAQTLRLSTSHIRRLRILVGPELIDMQKPITVIFNSKAAFKGLPGSRAISNQDLLQRVWETGETARLPEAIIELGS